MAPKAPKAPKAAKAGKAGKIGKKFVVPSLGAVLSGDGLRALATCPTVLQVRFDCHFLIESYSVLTVCECAVT
jgi:hypothetical protein